MPKIRVCDVNDFFSLTGGGVRRYHLEKLRYMSRRDDIEYHLLLPSDHASIEVHGNARIHHVPALALGRTGYRLMWNPWRLRKVLRGIRPDVVEVGSWHSTPDWVRLAVYGLTCQLVGFWHANYPVTDIGRNVTNYTRGLGKFGKWLSAGAERLAWWWTRRTFGRFSTTMAATHVMVDQLTSHGVDRVVHTPLGVDTQMFHPRHRDAQLRASWGAGPDDVVLCFPNRLAEEKNFRPLLRAYELLRSTTEQKPILVVAGHGPGRAEIEALAAKYPEVHYLGFLDKPRDMARLLASVDVVAVLSPYETFGLSAVEAMASGVALMGSAKMSIGELLQTCRCGIALDTINGETVAAAWLELMKPGRAALLGARGHAEAQQRYSWKATFARIIGVYEQVVARAAESTRPRIGSAIAGLIADESVPASTGGRRAVQANAVGRRASSATRPSRP
jgi:alpha-1,6-mannosyltransferase